MSGPIFHQTDCTWISYAADLHPIATQPILDHDIIFLPRQRSSFSSSISHSTHSIRDNIGEPTLSVSSTRSMN